MAAVAGSPVSVDINGFYLKTRAREGTENMLTQLAALLTLVINIFLLSPVLFIEYMSNPLYFEWVFGFILLCTPCTH